MPCGHLAVMATAWDHRFLVAGGNEQKGDCMLGGKLRMAPSCYHVLHLMAVMAAHEMNYFYDEGLRTDDGLPAYEIGRDSMVPFGLEKLGIAQAMKEKAVDIALDVQTRTIFFQRSKGADIYIIAGWRNQHIHV